jgi:hypothetical protein
MSFFFAMYDFYLNVSSSVKDNRLKSEVLTARKKAEEFENEDKKLKKRISIYFFIRDWVILTSIYLR